MNRFADAVKDFGLTISLKKDAGDGSGRGASITVAQYEVEAVHEFVYLDSVISNSLSLETEVRKATTTLSRLTKRVWSKSKLTEHTKVQDVQGLPIEHPTLRLRVMDSALDAGKKTPLLNLQP